METANAELRSLTACLLFRHKLQQEFITCYWRYNLRNQRSATPVYPFKPRSSRKHLQPLSPLMFIYWLTKFSFRNVYFQDALTPAYTICPRGTDQSGCYLQVALVVLLFTM